MALDGPLYDDYRSAVLSPIQNKSMAAVTSAPGAKAIAPRKTADDAATLAAANGDFSVIGGDNDVQVTFDLVVSGN